MICNGSPQKPRAWAQLWSRGCLLPVLIVALGGACATVESRERVDERVTGQRDIDPLRSSAPAVEACTLSGVNLLCQVNSLGTCRPRQEQRVARTRVTQNELTGFDPGFLGDPVSGKLNAIFYDVAMVFGGTVALLSSSALFLSRGAACLPAESSQDPLCIPHPVFGALVALAAPALIAPPIVDLVRSQDRSETLEPELRVITGDPVACAREPLVGANVVATPIVGDSLTAVTQAGGRLEITVPEALADEAGKPWLSLLVPGTRGPTIYQPSRAHRQAFKRAWVELRRWKAQASLTLQNVRADLKDGLDELALMQLIKLPQPASADDEARALLAEVETLSRELTRKRWLVRAPAALDRVAADIERGELQKAALGLKLIGRPPQGQDDEAIAAIVERYRQQEERLVTQMGRQVESLGDDAELEQVIAGLDDLRELIDRSGRAEHFAPAWERVRARAAQLAVTRALGADPKSNPFGLEGVLDQLDAAEQLARSAGLDEALAKLQQRRFELRKEP